MIYYINTKVNASFEQTVQFVKEALKAEGFGILTEIDMHEKLKEKLNVDFRKYKVLGAYSPLHAYKALQQDDKIGTLLPCNIIIQELAHNEVEVATVDPVISMLAVENSALVHMTKEIREMLTRIIRSLKHKGHVGIYSK